MDYPYMSPYELVRVGPECLLDTIMKSLEPREVSQIMGVPVKVCEWMPPNAMALFSKLGEIELIVITEEKR